MAPMTDASGIVTIPSRHSVDATLSRLENALAEKGIKLFAVIDHSGEAEKAGLKMPPTKVAIFGSPKAGTPVMDAAPLAALDLPLKVLIWADGDQTRIDYVDAAELGARYGLSDELAGRLAVIGAITDAAAAGS